jgi:hypothetical protein
MTTSRSRECADDITGMAQGAGAADDKTAAINARIRWRRKNGELMPVPAMPPLSDPRPYAHG